jgi:hypothetical protein
MTLQIWLVNTMNLLNIFPMKFRILSSTFIVPIIHQEALCAKDIMKSFQKVMETVTKIVNFIKS